MTHFVLHNLFHIITSYLFCSHLAFHTSSCHHRHQRCDFPSVLNECEQDWGCFDNSLCKDIIFMHSYWKRQIMRQWICTVICCASQSPEAAHFWFFLMCFLTWDPDVVGHVTSLFSIFDGVLHAVWIVNRPICTCISLALL